MSEHTPDKLDRAAILARRAALVASALSTFTVATRATAQEVPADPDPSATPAEGCPPRDRNPQQMAEARVHFEAATEAFQLDDFAEAAKRYEQAYVLYPSAKLLLPWMDALVKRGAPEAAFLAALAHVKCGGDDVTAVREKIAAIDAASARVIIVLNQTLSTPGTVYIDEVPTTPERMRVGIFLAPNVEHIIRVENRSGRATTKNVRLAAGQSSTVDIQVPPEVGPEPCLSVCLSIMPTRREGKVRLEMGIIPPFPVVNDDEPAGVLVGTGAQASICARITDKLWFEGQLFGFFFGDRTARVVPVGTSAEVRYYIVDQVWSVGLGFSGGYMFNVTDERYEERNYFRASPIFGPVITPMHLSFGVVSIAFRMHAWGAEASVNGIESFQLAVAAPHIAFSFGDFVDRKDSYE